VKIIATVIVVIAIEIGVVLGLIFFGWYNVAADAPDSTVVAWVVGHTRRNSIGARVQNAPAAPNLDRPNFIKHGAKLYAHHCSGCHLAPGMKATGVHLGLNPMPPHFAEFKHAPEPKEIYWIVYHGIRMTGMPGWRKTLSGRQIWAIAAFLQKLPGMSEGRYQQLTKDVSSP
jgi:mono/diheme cytochrome c family protein